MLRSPTEAFFSSVVALVHQKWMESILPHREQVRGEAVIMGVDGISDFTLAKRRSRIFDQDQPRPGVADAPDIHFRLCVVCIRPAPFVTAAKLRPDSAALRAGELSSLTHP
jgi:hypothetical protein